LPRSRPVVIRRALVLATVLAICIPAPGWTWGFATHHYIAQNYSKHLPPYIDGLRAYDGVVDQKVTDPDTRRPTTPGESYRHYIDIDNYPEFLAGTLTHDRAALEAQYGAATVLENGIVPWAVGEVVATLTVQFQNQQWSDAATTIADLCHYVGDACQPLHCTRNYDGQFSGNNGIHSRYETTMMSSHIGELTTPVTPVTYYPNPVDAMFDIIDDSWAGVSVVLDADNIARAASGGSFNSTYYASLWSSTQSMTRNRINIAAVATASFVYTAWNNAGQPAVPGSTVDVPAVRASGSYLVAGPTPFRDALSIQYAGAGPITVEVLDVRGARVEQIVDRASATGTVSWRPTRQLAPGVYFIRLTGPKDSIVRRVIRLD
jgi:hypothetical protein